MTYTLEIGPNLYTLLRYVLYAAIPVYVLVQWWYISGGTGRLK